MMGRKKYAGISAGLYVSRFSVTARLMVVRFVSELTLKMNTLAIVESVSSPRSKS